MPKSWSEKFTHPPKPVVSVLDKSYAGQEPGARMLIPTPAAVAAYVETIPKGEMRTMPQLRDDLAAAHRADFTCPLTAGIFLRIAAERAWEQHLEGKALSKITPFWRAVDLKSPMAKKLACGVDFIVQQREKESKTAE
ncbi:MAG: hypothetical protein JNG86_20600 [Verrucomicrobiaceae bacterium]|nr:hypothetical protein [Verrucomicrobiaceae bacterium]